MRTFTDRVAVVTGGASGIGLGMCRAFAARGMKLVIADLDQAALTAAVAEFESKGTPAIGEICDVSRLDAVQALADRTMATYGAYMSCATTQASAFPRRRER